MSDPLPSEPLRIPNPAQRGFLALERLGRGGAALNLCLLVPVEADASAEGTRDLLRTLLRDVPSWRHVATPDGLGLRTLAAEDIDVEIVELDAGAARHDAERIAHDLASTPFDTSLGPLHRFRVLSTAGRVRWLALCCHHLLADGWSLSRLVRLALGMPPPPPGPAASARPSPARQERDAAWWRSRQDTLPRAAEPAAHSTGLAARRHAFRIPSALLDGQDRAARFAGCAALALGHLSGLDDFCLGFLGHGRTTGDRNDPAPRVDKHAVEVRLDDATTLGEFLDGFRRTVREARRHGTFRFEALQTEISRRSGDASPLCQATFSFQPSSFALGPGLDAAACWIFPGKAAEALAFHLVEHADGTGDCTCLVDHQLEAFTPLQIRGLREVVEHLLESLPRQRDTRLSELQWLDDRTLDDLRRREHAPAPPRGIGDTFPERFGNMARIHPDRTAVRWSGGSWTYRELDRRSGALAAEFLARGAGPGSTIAILGPGGPDRIAAVVAALRSGTAFAPLDEASPPGRLGDLLAACGATHLCVDPSLDHRVPASWTGPRLTAFPAPDACPFPSHIRIDADAPAYVLCTSGTTGEPKAVVVGHRPWCAMADAWNAAYGLSERDVVLQVAPFCFDVFAGDLAKALLNGACLALPDADDRGHPSRLHAAATRLGATFVDTLPEHVLALGETALRRKETGRLRSLVCGARAPDPRRFRNLSRRLPPGIALYNTYGVTEATVDGAFLEADPADGSDLEPVPVGVPFPGVSLHVRARRGPLPEGWTGDLLVGGAGVARGYLDEPDSPRFRTLAGVGRVYDSGDRARWNGHGQLVWCGRRDDEIKMSGVRVHPAAIEAALESLEGVEDAVVVAVPEGGRVRVEAFCVCPGRPATDELRAELGTRLPRALHPHAIHRLEDLPRGPSGKPDMARLRALASRPRDAGPTPGESSALPDRIRRNLSGLGIPDAELADPRNVDRSLWSLGLDSLAAFQFLGRLEEDGLHLVPSDLHAHPTIGDLARLLEHATPRAPRPLPPPPPPRSATRRHSDRPAILLTGATGLVGIAVLERLSRLGAGPILCLVRGDAARLRESWQRSGSAHPFPSDRARLVPGDLSRPNLGLDPSAFEALAAEVGLVIHAGAWTRYFGAPEAIHGTNVEGTRTLASWCARHGIALAHVSSASASSPIPAGWNPYVDSKRRAEEVVLASGAPGLVLRLGALLPGAEDRRPADSALSARLRTLVELGSWPRGLRPPALGDASLVGAAADAIVAQSLSLRERPPERPLVVRLRGLPLEAEAMATAFAARGRAIHPLEPEAWSRAARQHPMGAMMTRELSFATGLAGSGASLADRTLDVSGGAHEALERLFDAVVRDAAPAGAPLNGARPDRR